MRLFYFVLIGVILTSCGKYDGGPEFSIMPKKSRLTGNWQLKSNVTVQTDLLPLYKMIRYTYTTYDMDFDKSGDWDVDLKADVWALEDYWYDSDGILSFYLTAVHEFSVEDRAVGEWRWNDKKAEIKITINDSFSTYTILELTSKELKLEDEFGNIWTFEKQK